MAQPEFCTGCIYQWGEQCGGCVDGSGYNPGALSSKIAAAYMFITGKMPRDTVFDQALKYEGNRMAPPDPRCGVCKHFNDEVAGGSSYPKGRCEPMAEYLAKAGYPSSPDGEEVNANTPCPNCPSFGLTKDAEADRDEELNHRRELRRA